MSTLLQVRQKLVKDSGHYNLVVDGMNSDWTDNGANDLINQGQRWLDRKFEYDKQQAWYTQVLSQGQSLLTFAKARYIERVQIATTTDGRIELDRKNFFDLQTEYKTVPLSSVEESQPLYWCPLVPGLAPELYSETSGSLTTDGVVDIDFYQYGNHYLTSAIMILPPPEQDYTVKVLARWLSKELSDDADVSFWSVNAPELLVRAARLQLETDLHRNPEGAMGFEQRLLDDLGDFYRDFKAEAVSGPASDWVMNG